MEQMIEIFDKLNVPADVREKIISECGDDENRITQFLLACLARYDDSHEFMD